MKNSGDVKQKGERNWKGWEGKTKKQAAERSFEGFFFSCEKCRNSEYFIILF